MATESKSDLISTTTSTGEIIMRRQFHIDVLSIFFGIGTWVVVNGLWVELPLLVQTLPESWNLPSFLSIIVQISNIGPILYTVLHSMYKDIFTETRVIYFIIILGLIANGLLIEFWDYTNYIAGTERSTALLVLVFFLAMVDTSSRVLYLPFMARFQSMYLTSYFIGEGLSGLVPSVFALIQGSGGNPECVIVNKTVDNVTTQEIQSVTPDPLFSVPIFFGLLFVTVFLSLVAFHLLTYDSITVRALALTTSKHEGPTNVLLNAAEPPTSFYNSTSPSSSSEDLSKSEGAGVVIQNRILEQVNINTGKPKMFQHVSKPAFICLLIAQAVVCALANGSFPSIQSFSCLPYGNVAYHWTATLSTMANPAVCFLLFALPKPTSTSITSVAVATIGVACYVMSTAVMSPTPPLVEATSGKVLLVSSWILLVGGFTYIKVSIATILRGEGKRGLFWCGALTQVGSASGAIVMFLLVNYVKIFKSYDACAGMEIVTPDTVNVI